MLNDDSNSSKLKPTLIVLLVIAILVVGGFLYKSYRDNKSIVNTTSGVVKDPKFATRQAQDVFFDSQSTIIVPIINSKTSISFEDLPDNVKTFISPEGVDFKVEKVLYENNKNGFSVNYKISKTIVESHKYFFNLLLRNSVLIGSAYTNYSSIMEVRNKDYEVKITQFDENNGTLDVNTVFVPLI